MGEFKTKTIIFFTLSIIFALTAAYIFLSNVRETEQALGEMVSVVIAREDIVANETISADKLETTEIPRKFATSSLMTDLEKTANMISLVPIKKGDLITQSMLRTKGDQEIPTDFRMVYLREPIVVFDGTFAIGDRVDVYVTSEQSSKGKATLLLQSDLEIINLTKNKEEHLTSMGVIVPIKEVPDIVQALNQAKEVRVLKRPVGN